MHDTVGTANGHGPPSAPPRRTGAVEVPAERARPVPRDPEAVRAAAARAPGGGPAGRVDVAAASSSGPEPVVDAVAELRERHPGVTAGVSSAGSATEVVAMVARGRCESGVGGSSARPAGHGPTAHRLRDAGVPAGAAAVHRFDPAERIARWLVHRGGPVASVTRAFLGTALAWAADRASSAV
ncbi:LysR substrate-binding domain-containing protein [Streptomyces minutiscleroticus]|nr:LysR substrate-binding domain-containing protein [Streptomyces minutiscleroticus]